MGEPLQPFRLPLVLRQPRVSQHDRRANRCQGALSRSALRVLVYATDLRRYRETLGRCAMSEGAETWALVVAIDDYDGLTVPDLTGPCADAVAALLWLRTLGTPTGALRAVCTPT